MTGSVTVAEPGSPPPADPEPPTVDVDLTPAAMG